MNIKNRVYNYNFDNLIKKKKKKLEAKNILIDEENYKDLYQICSQEVDKNEILHHHELSEKIEEHKKIYT